MSYAEHLAANRRLAILKLMLEEAGHANDSILELGLRELGHRKGLERAVVRSMMRVLEALDCLTIEIVHDTVMVAHITPRGRLVAAGDLEVDGIASPHNGLCAMGSVNRPSSIDQLPEELRGLKTGKAAWRERGGQYV